MINPVDIMPDHLLEPQRKEQALQWLREASLTKITKQRLLLGWGNYVGVKITGDEYKAIGNYGVDIR